MFPSTVSHWGTLQYVGMKHPCYAKETYTAMNSVLRGCMHTPTTPTVWVRMYILQGEGFDGVVVEIWSQLGGHYKAYVRPLIGGGTIVFGQHVTTCYVYCICC